MIRKKPPSDEEFIDFEFGVLIKSLREYRKLSIIDVANLTGIRLPRLIELEQGRPLKSVTKRECKQIAKIIGIDMNVLISKALGK